MGWDIKKYVFAIFIILSAIFFYRSFTGDSIQGNRLVSDSPLGITEHYSRMIGNTTGNWVDYELMGNSVGNIQISMYTLYSYILPVGMVLGASYFTALLFSLIFGYLFLRKLKLDPFPSIFGSIAYAFSPTIISYIYAGHVQVVCSLSYAPAIFYFLACAFDPEENDLLKELLMLFLSGIFMGLMFSDEVQRSLYFIILGAFFVLYRIFVRNRIGLKDMKKADFRGFIKDFLKSIIIPLIFLSAAYSGSSFLLQALNTRMAIQNTALEISRSSAESWDFASSYSMHPFEMIDSLAFGFHGNSSLEPDQQYWGSKEFSSSNDSLGFFVIIFALIGSIAYYKKSSLMRFFLFGGIISLLLSFGKYWPGVPFFWIFYHLPFMSNFRAPVKFLSVTAFCFAVLSAYGIKYLMEILTEKFGESERLFIAIERVLAVALCAGILTTLIVFAVSGDIAIGFNISSGGQNSGQIMTNNMIYSLIRMDIFIALTLILIIVFSRGRRFSKWAGGSLIPAAFLLMLIIDLWSIDLYYVNRSYIRINKFYGQDTPVAYLREAGKKERFRVITSLMIPARNGIGNLPVISRANRELYLTFWFSYYDIDPLELVASSGKDQELNNFFNTFFLRSSLKEIRTPDDLLNPNLSLFQLSGVKYIVTDGYLYDYGGGRIIAALAGNLTNNTNCSIVSVGTGYEGGQEAVFELKNYIPLLALYENFVTVKSNGEALKYLSDPNYDYLRSVVVNAPVAGRKDMNGLYLSQAVTAYKDWDIKAKIDSPAPSGGALLFNTRFAPGWKAFIDGKPVPVYKANYIQMAVFVNSGKHTAEFRYGPDSTSFLVSFITVITGLAWAFLYALYRLIFKSKRTGPV